MVSVSMTNDHLSPKEQESKDLKATWTTMTPQQISMWIDK